MPGTAVTKSVVANEPGGRKREEIFVDVIEKISVTFSSSVRAPFSDYLFIFNLTFIIFFGFAAYHYISMPLFGIPSYRILCVLQGYILTERKSVW